ncbi:hypothetical protein SASPL_122987 [Salvia splendens]|uniref:Uncharacterized protein n=1 Tax=Salvia splendens TaxID=180675 RepID=A0A8X8ZTJ2_SALSN|nr:hypothetical protein SASPL_122987 [Salvia splendens]
MRISTNATPSGDPVSKDPSLIPPFHVGAVDGIRLAGGENGGDEGSGVEGEELNELNSFTRTESYAAATCWRHVVVVILLITEAILMSDRDRAEGDEGGGINGGDEEDREWKCKRCGSKGKRPAFFRLRKSRKLLQQKRKQSGVYVNSRSWGRSGGWCCLCLRQPKTLDSSGESPSSDPNSSEFSFDELRALIEKNDFYSEDCNPHFDA